jgi:hypothetical protein
METNSAETQQVMERLARVERQNRWLVRGGLALVLCCGIVLLLAQKSVARDTETQKENGRETIFFGTELSLGMLEDAVIKRIAEKGYGARKESSIAGELRNNYGVTSLWIVAGQGMAGDIGMIGFAAGKLNYAQKWLWSSMSATNTKSSAESVEFGRQLFFAARDLEAEGNTRCTIETRTTDRPRYSRKFLNLGCGHTSVLVDVQKFVDQEENAQLSEELSAPKLESAP